jgi:glycosyltransferase involved in cell wall biosynthesis
VVKSVVFAVPGDLATPTGGYAYDRRIIAELVEFGWSIDVLDLGDGFPHPTAAEVFAASAQLAALPNDGPVVIDGLAFGVLPDAAAALHLSHRVVALVHHPLALESGLTAEESETMHASERAALSFAHHVITTSAATARLLTADFDVPSDRLTVVRPGTDRAITKAGTKGGLITLLAVGSVVPRKGYDVLVAALATLADLPWRLVIVGDRGRGAETARQLDAEIARHDLASRVSFAGAVAHGKLADYYSSADLFVLPSRFEGYGMAYAEAIAHGLPVVGTTAGAIPDTVPETAGVLVPPDDVGALATALRRLIANPQERQRLAEGAVAAAARFPGWQEQAALFAHVLETLS